MISGDITLDGANVSVDRLDAKRYCLTVESGELTLDVKMSGSDLASLRTQITDYLGPEES